MNYEQASNRGTKTNPIIGGRMALSDCSQVTDGAATVILVSESYMESHSIKGKYPCVKGFGHRTAPMVLKDKLAESRDSKYVLPWTRQTILDAYERAGLTVEDIDVFETHDCFSISEYAAISAFGITEPGLEYEAIYDGRILWGGE